MARRRGAHVPFPRRWIRTSLPEFDSSLQHHGSNTPTIFLSMLATQRSDHMRLGLIADIHGNKLALDTVLAQLQHRAVDTIVCLGDVAMLGPQPAESIATLQALQIPVVMGNTDAWFFGGDQPGPETSLLAHWCRDQVSRDGI